MCVCVCVRVDIYITQGLLKATKSWSNIPHFCCHQISCMLTKYNLFVSKIYFFMCTFYYCFHNLYYLVEYKHEMRAVLFKLLNVFEILNQVAKKSLELCIEKQKQNDWVGNVNSMIILVLDCLANMFAFSFHLKTTIWR